ncbi:MAG TPA: RDD family protein [Pyrinomonadaceae bacterium]|nr:RDD family protein [Pyrinomonadaceae bacterium]
MTAVSDRTVEVKRPAAREVVIGFSAAAVRAPFLLRCGALIIDYIIVVAIPVIALLLSRFAGNDGTKLLNEGLSTVGWLIGILLGITNMVFLPMFTGQTFGKIVTGLRIVRIDGTTPAIGAVAFRQTVGYFLTLASFGIGFFVSVFGSKGRALHDYLSGTVVIRADRRIKR